MSYKASLYIQIASSAGVQPIDSVAIELVDSSTWIIDGSDSLQLNGNGPVGDEENIPFGTISLSNKAFSFYQGKATTSNPNGFLLKIPFQSEQESVEFKATISNYNNFLTTYQVVYLGQGSGYQALPKQQTSTITAKFPQ